MRRLRLWLVAGTLLASVLSGCASRGDAPTPLPNGTVDLQVTAFPRGSTISWYVLVDNHSPESYTDATVHLDAHRRGNVPVGSAESSTDAPAKNATRLRLETRFIGPGDYYYTVTFTTHDRKSTTSVEGMWETCLC